jgi:signal transduction histidine kinase
MGRRGVVTQKRRTAVAAIALAVAVVLPTTAWYLTGSSDAARRARLLEEATITGLQNEVHRDSDRLATRLEHLRSSEAERPFFHYQSITHDPDGAAEGLAVAPSPLAQGVSDPLVWAHFQLDEFGLVSLPNVNERFPELSSTKNFARFCSLLAELQNAMALGLEDSVGIEGGYFEGELIPLRRSEWEQIRDADKVYAAITGRGGAATRRPSGAKGDVIIRVGPLEWHSMVFGSGPTLAALREVETPLGIRLQGFAVAPSGVEQWLGSDASTQIDFTPFSKLPPDRLASSVADTGWWLSADPEPLVQLAREEGREAILQFRRIFALGAAAVLFSALAVVVVIFQTDRLARQRGRFAASAAHELKTPLASLRLYSEMLSEGLGRPEQSKVYASRVAAESGRLGRVVSNMLDLARLERGGQIANPQPGDLGAAVFGCIDRLRPNLEESGLAIDLEIEEGLPTANFDDDALCQIIDNLLDNAEKYTREQPERLADVTVRTATDGIEVRVGDNGPGIQGISHRALFKPFQRPAGDDAPAGLALGLALARSLARAQGGDLVLADEQATGATFVFTVALA